MRHLRLKEIEGYLMRRESASLEELCERFSVSKITIRRDLAALEELGIAKKVYGGVLLSPISENLTPFRAREMAESEEKQMIGRLAAALVQDDDIIFIDAGSTTAALVPYLDPTYRLTIITNSVSVIVAIAGKPSFRLIVVGGEYLRETCSLVGIDAIESIRKLNARIAFLGASGISLAKGVTNSSSIEAEIKRAIIQVSERRVLLADSKKFDRASLVKFCDISDIGTIVSDKTPPEPYLREMERYGVRIVVPGRKEQAR